MNWMDCPFVETVPGKLSGAPVIIHSRVRPEDLILNRSEGPDWLAENFELPVGLVRALLAFYDSATLREADPV
jgi:uncharacterized protein (DUF433 family)